MLQKSSNLRVKKIVSSVLLSLLHATICMCAGALGWYNQLIVVTLVSCTVIYINWHVIKLNPIQALIPLLPFYLVFVIISFILQSYQVFPVWIVGLITSCVCLYLLKNKVKNIIIIGAICLLVLVGRYVIMPNNFAYLYQLDGSSFHFKDLTIIDSNKKVIPMSRFKGKITVFDVWNTNCAICIRQFPEIEKLYDHYQSDTSVLIYTLNLPLIRQEGNPLNYVRKYHFQAASVSDMSESKKIPIRAFPNVVVLDKDLHCVYAGQLNTDMNIFIGNIHRIIERLKKINE